ncbi:hypothetical protein [Zooshikella ganghwensis]|uniref:Uncharacterized protein n=1 Tax=Zooshikella ganghwensis TaxID=202772 RepID=A0A4P9VUI9_9GAMM|nr:hypothetical protein [Zooshikella ganghwensis]RDH46589.1 hypothetical protein B9G39_25790 [Zooshikella ganghwensis]
MTSAQCIDGQYQESQRANPQVDIKGILSSHNPNASVSVLSKTVTAALEKRYPFGAEILSQAPNSSGQKCLTYWMQRAKSTWGDLPTSELFHGADLSVHECGHGLSHKLSGWSTQALPLSKGTTPVCPVRGPYKYPPLYNLQHDKFSKDVPNNHYDSTYINKGSPVGKQGWESVIDEAVQYSHSLAIGYAFHDYTTYGSDADGALSFAWYIQRYYTFCIITTQIFIKKF